MLDAEDVVDEFQERDSGLYKTTSFNKDSIQMNIDEQQNKLSETDKVYITDHFNTSESGL